MTCSTKVFAGVDGASTIAGARGRRIVAEAEDCALIFG